MLKREMLLSRSQITFVHIITAYLLLIEILKCINLPFSHVSKCTRPAQRGGASSHDIAWPVIDKLWDFMGTYVNVSLMLYCLPQAINLNYSGFEKKKKAPAHSMLRSVGDQPVWYLLSLEEGEPALYIHVLYILYCILQTETIEKLHVGGLCANEPGSLSVTWSCTMGGGG